MQSLQKEVRRGLPEPSHVKENISMDNNGNQVGFDVMIEVQMILYPNSRYMERFETLGTRTQGSCKIPPHQATRSCFIYKKLTFFSVPKQPANNLYMRNRQGTRNRMSICFLAFIARWSIKWSKLTNTLSIPKSFWINVTQSI